MIALASAIALLDVFFILVAVPESLPEKLRPASWGSQISWDKADPFGVCACTSSLNFSLNIVIDHRTNWSLVLMPGDDVCFFMYIHCFYYLVDFVDSKIQ